MTTDRVEAQVLHMDTELGEVLVWGKTKAGDPICVHVGGIHPTISISLLEKNILNVVETQGKLEKYLHNDLRTRECNRTFCDGCSSVAPASSSSSAPPPTTAPATKPPILVMCNEPCVRDLQRAFSSAQLVVDAHVIWRTPHPIYTRDKRPYLEFTLVDTAFVGPTKRFLKGLIKKMRETDPAWWHVEVCGVNAGSDATMQLAYLADVGGNDWISVPRNSRITNPSRLLCDPTKVTEYAVDFGRGELKIHPERTDPAPLRKLAFDIETRVMSGPVVPGAGAAFCICVYGYDTRTPDEPIMVALDRAGTTTDQVAPLAGVDVRMHADEKDLLLAFRDLVRSYDPDIITGYNDAGFDWPALLIRADKLGVGRAFREMGRLRGRRMVMLETAQKTKVTNKAIRYFRHSGRWIVDTMTVVKMKRSLQSYSLKDVVEEVLNDGRSKYEFDIHKLNDHHDGTPQMRREVLKYCSIDAMRPMELMDTIRGDVGLMAEAKVKGTLPHQSTTHGMQKGLQRLLYKFATRDDVIFHEHEKVDVAVEAEMMGRTVELVHVKTTAEKLEEKRAERRKEYNPDDCKKLVSMWNAYGRPGEEEKEEKEDDEGDEGEAMGWEAAVQYMDEIHAEAEEKEGEEKKPQTAVDRARLVPLILAYKGMALPTAPKAKEEEKDEKETKPKKKMTGKEQNQKMKEEMRAAEKRRVAAQKKAASGVVAGEGFSREIGYEGALVLPPDVGVHDDTINTLDFNALYPNIIRAHNICSTTIVPSVAYAISQGLDPAKDLIFCPYGIFVAHHIRVGILPKALTYLLEKRNEVRKKEMPKFPKGSPQYVALDMLQLAYKIAANSFYGGMGFAMSFMFLIFGAASVTKIGRETLQRVVDWLHTPDALRATMAHLPPDFPIPSALKVTYGDTDSAFYKMLPPVDGPKFTAVQAVQFGMASSTAVNAAGLFPSPMSMAYEKSSVYTIHLAAKCYVMVKVENVKDAAAGKFDLLVKGLAGIRRSVPRVARDTFNAVVHKMMYERLPLEELEGYLAHRTKMLALGPDMTVDDQETMEKEAEVFGDDGVDYSLWRAPKFVEGMDRRDWLVGVMSSLGGKFSGGDLCESCMSLEVEERKEFVGAEVLERERRRKAEAEALRKARGEPEPKEVHPWEEDDARGRFTLKAFAITRQLRMEPKDYKNQKLPHVIVATNYEAMGIPKPAVGDRLTYVVAHAMVIDEKTKTKKLKMAEAQYLKVATEQQIRSGEKFLDVDAYMDAALRKPMEKLMGPLLGKARLAAALDLTKYPRVVMHNDLRYEDSVLGRYVGMAGAHKPVVRTGAKKAPSAVAKKKETEAKAVAGTNVGVWGAFMKKA